MNMTVLSIFFLTVSHKCHSVRMINTFRGARMTVKKAKNQKKQHVVIAA